MCAAKLICFQYSFILLAYVITLNFALWTKLNVYLFTLQYRVGAHHSLFMIWKQKKKIKKGTLYDYMAPQHEQSIGKCGMGDDTQGKEKVK